MSGAFLVQSYMEASVMLCVFVLEIIKEKKKRTDQKLFVKHLNRFSRGSLRVYHCMEGAIKPLYALEQSTIKSDSSVGHRVVKQ